MEIVAYLICVFSPGLFFLLGYKIGSSRGRWQAIREMEVPMRRAEIEIQLDTIDGFDWIEELSKKESADEEK